MQAEAIPYNVVSPLTLLARASGSSVNISELKAAPMAAGVLPSAGCAVLLPSEATAYIFNRDDVSHLGWIVVGRGRTTDALPCCPPPHPPSPDPALESWVHILGAWF